MTAPDLKEPCGECYLPSRETCDICGAISPSPKVIASLPERIWTASTNGKCHVGFDTPSLNYTNEYVRADLARTPTLAEALAVPTDAQVASACLSYRHDFGLLDAKERALLMFQAREWLHAWRKELPALRAIGEGNL